MLLRRTAFLVCFFAALGGGAAAQVLNMSHDLTTLGIAAQNMTPNNPALDARPLFQAALNYVQSHPVQTLTLDTGAYYLLTNTQSNAVLLFSQLSNLTVDLAGSTLYFNGPLVPNGLAIYYCSNLTLTNFQIDFVHPPYTHVQLTSVDTVNRLLRYQTLPNWPDPSTFNSLTSPFGGPIQGYWAAIFRNGSIVPGTTRTLLQAPFTNNTITIQDQSPWAQAPTLATLESGDTVVVYARGGGPIFWVFYGNGLTFSNIAIYGAQGVQLLSTSNSTMKNMRFAPRPGSGLVGGVGGIGILPPGPNNHILNCYVARTLDDALVFEESGPATVVSQSGSRQLTVANQGYRFPNGTAMNFVDPGTTLESVGGVIVDQNPPDNPNPMAGNVTLTFDRDLPTIAPGTFMVFGSASTRGQGSTVEDSLIEDTYGGHGILLQGVEGIIVQRNVVRRTSMAGIHVDQSADAAVDSADLNPPSHDVIISDNVLEATLGPAPCGTGIQFCLGAIEIVSTNNQAFGFASSPANTNITVQNNYIADTGRSGIWIGELNGGTLQDNLVIRSSQNPTLGGTSGIPAQFASQVMQDALVPVVIHYSSAVAEVGDTISATSPIMAPVTMTPPNAALPEAGGAGSFNLQTAVTGFGWNAASDSSWLTVTSTVPGSGSGTVQYSVAPNATGAARMGNIMIAGVAFPVLQTTLTTPVLTITKTHAGNFTIGQTGGTYILTASNQAGAASSGGLVTVTDILPSGLTLVSMAGSGWTCTGASCTRNDSLAGGASYPTITVTVNVAANATSPQVNQASVSGGGSAPANASDSTIIVNPAAIVLGSNKVQFGYSGQQISGAQTVGLSFNPAGAIAWTATSNQANITVSPSSGTGSAQLQIAAAPGASGIITVTAPGATNSPQQIQVNVTSVAVGLPYGSFDTPLNNTAGIAGAVPVTGWALDAIQATNVGIWREPVVGETAQSNGLVFIGNAVFVAGARPDVQATYPNAPFNYRGGWGYMLLTNFLPNASGSGPLGNGTYKLHAIITNATGQTLDLGAHAITVDNVHAAKPFGTIDTPAQGGTVSGNSYVNFGWALTQNPYAIPTDGSTISVIVDGVAVGHPVYNNYRSDVANLFPGLANSNGAVGFFYIDTTALANGVHTISWNVFDNAGRGDGIGSRYFTVLNTGTVAPPAVTDEPVAAPADDSITARVGFRQLEALPRASDGRYLVDTEELDRVELRVGASEGHLLVAGELRSLPIGSTLRGGVFYWQAGPGFLGEYELVFGRPGAAPVRVRVVIHPKSYAPARLQ